ncbi:hypothetical protein BDR06DRAFT_982073 [Suillus hirtellus]|nr:hypothetical protein BDR06DRAFT_982073 [Suillus hirtellus]
MSVARSKPVVPCPSLWSNTGRHQTLASKVPISHGTGAEQQSSADSDDRLDSNAFEADSALATQEADSDTLPPPYPFHNMTIYRLMSWMNSGSNKKSELEVAHLIKEVMLAEDFDAKHLENFLVRGSLWKLDNVHRFHFCPLINVIWSAFSDIQASAFHLSPFKHLWKDPLDGHQEQIFDELYTSDSWLDAQDELQKLPREPGCALEWVIAGLMFFSDATHLANFRMAKAWPLYIFLPSSSMAALYTHCRCELFHGCWDILLDEGFLHAYHHGIVLKCADGVLHRIFPQIFTYSADYPNKVLIATIKDMGSCLCPRCLTLKSMFTSLGLLKDMQSRISNLQVYVMTNVNKFVERLGALGLNPFQMLVVNLMHECELGTWKALFTHLIKILYALLNGNQLVAIIDSRFRQIPTFSNGCAIPVFEGLFPASHDMVVQSLLFRFAQWHALAKLRIHSESTLSFFEDTFKKLSRQLRKFRDFTCAVFDTVELPKEKAAHQRRVAQRAGPNGISSESSIPRVKIFNLSTYKFHTMGDYLQTIKLFSTTDSFTTQIGKLAHRALKAFYPLTSKVDTLAQLAKHEHRPAGISSSNQQSPADTHAPSLSNDHHFITINGNNPVSLFTFLQEHNSDPATKDFIPKLKDHLLYRLKKLDVTHCDRTFTDEEQNSLIIPNNTIYSVQTMQIYYTTYDMRHEYNTVNPRTHADVMVLSGETSPSHPYWYARVLGIYHLDVWLEGHIDILYVWWLAPLISLDYELGIQHARLPKLAFVEESDHDAFGFLNPGQVICGAHLIPAFVSGRGVSSLRYRKSLGRPKEELTDWEAYYIGIFVDRDMFLHYISLGVGHPVALRKIVRDCFGLEAAALALEAMDVDDGLEGEGDKGEGDKGEGDKGEEDKGEEDEGEEDKGEEDKGEPEEDAEEFDDSDEPDDLSF